MIFSRGSYRVPLRIPSLNRLKNKSSYLKKDIERHVTRRFLKVKAYWVWLRREGLRRGRGDIDVHVERPAAGVDVSAESSQPSYSSSSNSTLRQQHDIDRLLKKAQRYLSSGEDGCQWKFVGASNSIQVFKADKALSSVKNELRWPCFKTVSVVNCSIDRLYDCLTDSDKIMQYSEWTAGRDVVEKDTSTNTAITWTRSKSVFNMKPHDFCTLSHACRVNDSTVMVVMKGVKDHPAAPPRQDYSRSEIIFSLNVLTDVTATLPLSVDMSSTQSQTKLITISHVAYTGVFPFLVSSRAYQGIIDFMTALDAYATSPHASDEIKESIPQNEQTI